MIFCNRPALDEAARPGVRDRLPELIERWAGQTIDERHFPSARVADLRAAGLLSRFAAIEPGSRTTELLDALRLIGGADLSVGRIFEGHVNAVQLVTAYGSGSQRRELACDLTAGRLFGVWSTEVEPGLSIGPLATGGWRLAGAKTFATGAGHLDRVLVTAKLPDGGKQMVAVDLAGQDGRADASGWRVRGMKGTLSGRFDFSDMIVGGEALLGAPGDYEREPRFSAGAWRFTAAQLGAIEALARHLRAHLTAAGKDADPIQRARFAACVVAARTAGIWVSRAADRAERGGADAVPVVLMTRGVVEDAGLLVMEAAVRGVGTASFFTGNPIDRITRDLGLYLRQPAPDAARDRAATAWLAADPWTDDPWW